MSEKHNSNNKSRSGRGGRGQFNNQGHFNQQLKTNDSEKLQYSLKFYPYNSKSEEKDKKIQRMLK